MNKQKKKNIYRNIERTISERARRDIFVSARWANTRTVFGFRFFFNPNNELISAKEKATKSKIVSSRTDPDVCNCETKKQKHMDTFDGKSFRFPYTHTRMGLVDQFRRFPGDDTTIGVGRFAVRTRVTRFPVFRHESGRSGRGFRDGRYAGARARVLTASAIRDR